MAQTRGVFPGGYNRVSHGAEPQKESAAELAPAKIVMDIMGKGATKGLWGPEPLMKGGVMGHFGPIYVAFAASKYIRLVVGKESSEVHGLGIVQGVHRETSHIRIAKAETMWARGTGKGVTESLACRKQYWPGGSGTGTREGGTLGKPKSKSPVT